MDRVLITGSGSDHEDLQRRLSAATFDVARASDLAGALDRLATGEFACLLVGETERDPGSVVDRVRRAGHALPAVVLADDAPPATTDVAGVAPSDEPDAVVEHVETAVADHRTATKRRLRRRQRETIRAARDVLGDADDRETALDELCRVLTEGRPYDVAWVARIDGDRGRPLAAAGLSLSHLGNVSVGDDDDSPAAWAVATGSVAADGDGRRRTIAVPLGDGPAAVLVLAGDRPGDVSHAERSELADLGDDVGGLFDGGRDTDTVAGDRLAVLSDTFSHELSNQLDVATTHLELARERDEESHFEHVSDALDRLTSLADESRLLARGEVSTEPVELSEAAESAWAAVDAPEATMDVEDATVEADPDLLGLLLENLFRNSVEHGSTGSQRGSRADDSVEDSGDGVRIRVGPDGDGFAVADDGPGIPPEERDAVLEWGYSTDGTGAGLGIVRLVAERHGWSVDVTESDVGGARFEIS